MARASCSIESSSCSSRSSPIIQKFNHGAMSDRLCIKSERLGLRTFQKKHIPAITKLLNNWDVVKYGTIPYPVSETYWEKRLAEASKDSLMLVITTQQDGVIGYMILRNPSECAIHVHLK